MQFEKYCWAGFKEFIILSYGCSELFVYNHKAPQNQT